MRVVVRADASAQIGLGHLRRCLSLAAALRHQGHETLFAWRDAGLNVGALAAQKGFGDRRLAASAAGAWTRSALPHSHWLEAPSSEDAAQTAQVLTESQADAVIVDHYAIAADWHDAVRSGSAAHVIVIDDLADRPLAPDLLVDPNPSADHRRKYSDVLRSEAVPILGGPTYALLDPVYADHAKFVLHEQPWSIGVFMGGTDPGGFTEFTLDVLRRVVCFSGPIEVVSTVANPRLASLRDRAGADPAIMLTLDTPDLADFFSRHDLQVGAGGGALWERCCIGAPTVALVCADNQLLSVPLLHAMGVVVGVDVRSRGRPEADLLAGHIRDLLANASARRELSRRSMDLVDGRGASRVAAQVAALGGKR